MSSTRDKDSKMTEEEESNNISLMVYVITLLAAMQLPVAYTCAATPQVTTPTPTRPPTPAPVPPPTPIPPGMFLKIIFDYIYQQMICCQPLLVTPTNNINLANGIMSFTYNSNTCRALAIATCSQPTVTPPLQLMAGVTANQVNFINFQPTTVSVPLICNSAKQWQIGEPPLIISTIECVLSTL
ncbi:hypothetical protein DINM_021243 [Dirofilaria immitis]|nr:hypothetical protein [Dirofilaria immitis]